jgi:zinc transport system permease protein
VTLVLKRFSFIGDSLSHLAFGVMTFAAVIGLTNEMVIVLPATILCAVILLKSGARRRGDAALAMLSVGSLAVGYVVMNLFPTSSNISADVCSTLFGSTSILTLTQSEVWLCLVLATIVIVLFILFYNKLFAITFDESFAVAAGTKTSLYNTAIAIVAAVVIVVALNLVGSLLISALIIFPAISSMKVCRNFKAVTICSACISVICAVFGILLSILAGTPVGPTIVIANIIAFVIFSIIRTFRRG